MRREGLSTAVLNEMMTCLEQNCMAAAEPSLPSQQVSRSGVLSHVCHLGLSNCYLLAC